MLLLHDDFSTCPQRLLFKAIQQRERNFILLNLNGFLLFDKSKRQAEMITPNLSSEQAVFSKFTPHANFMLSRYDSTWYLSSFV